MRNSALKNARFAAKLAATRRAASAKATATRAACVGQHAQGRQMFRAISFERHGYLAEETVGFIKQLAYCRALALGLEPSAEIRRWYGVISCCIQRANAKILRGEPVPGRHSPPPPRLIARGRDLALVGA